MSDLIENTEVKKIGLKTKSIRITIEKLEGGFISDLEGKRKIYQDADDIMGISGINKIFHRMDNEEYKLNVDLIPKDEYEDYIDILGVLKQEKEEIEKITISEAKDRGIIQTEKYNPNKIPETIDGNEIKITKSNAYSAARLKTINWKDYDEKFPLSITEKADITGFKKNSLYNIWHNAVTGTSKFQVTETRIGMTILAKFYETNLGFRTSAKEENELIKSQMFQNIRELELLCKEGKFVKPAEILKIVSTMRKTLL